VALVLIGNGFQGLGEQKMSSPEQAENDQSSNGSGVGALLKASRLRFGEDLREVADTLRIRYVYMEAIEDGRYEDLPGATYAVGFIRAYADHLGLDSDEIIRRYKGGDKGDDPSSDLVFSEPISGAGIPGGAIVFVGALVAALSYGIWYMNTSEDGFLAELISPVPDRLAKLAPEQAQPEKAVPETEPTAPAEPGKDAEKEPEKEPEKVAEQEPEKAAEKEPQPQAPAETENQPAAVETAEQQAAAWQPPPGVFKPPAQESAASQPAAETAPETAAPAPAGNRPAPAPETTTPSVSATVNAGETSPAAPETQATPAAATAPTAQAPEPAKPPTVVPMDMIPSVPAPQPAATEATPPVAAADEKKPVPETASAPANEQAPAAEPAPQPTMGAGGAGRIVVKAKTNSWIQVRDDAAGELLLTRMLKSGDSYAVPKRSGLILSTGNAGALEILVDGEPVPAIGGEGTVRRKIVLDAERLKSGTAVRQ
jgi:cytoskeletal protein RodZ